MGKVLHSLATATANGEVLNTRAFTDVTFQISGTFVATVTFEGTLDGSNWIAFRATNLNSGTAATTAAAAGLYTATIGGLTSVRAGISLYTSGSVTVLVAGWSR